MPAEAVARRQIGVGAALHGGDLHHAGEPGGGAGEKAGDQNELADAEPHDLGGADIAAGDARGEAEHRVVDQDVGEHRRDDAEAQSPNARRCREWCRSC